MRIKKRGEMENEIERERAAGLERKHTKFEKKCEDAKSAKRGNVESAKK